jgi:hypothetical protein
VIIITLVSTGGMYVINKRSLTSGQLSILPQEHHSRDGRIVGLGARQIKYNLFPLPSILGVTPISQTLLKNSILTLTGQIRGVPTSKVQYSESVEFVPFERAVMISFNPSNAKVLSL